MTEDAVRAVFFKNYDGGHPNEALMMSVEQIVVAIIREGAEQPESLPEIIGAIAIGKSRIALFARMADGVRAAVPMHHLAYFDQIRKAMTDVVRYTRDNLEAMSPWFRERFTKEDLESISSEMASAMERSAGRYTSNVRAFHSGELKLYEEFFNKALIGIIGPDKFQAYAKEFNKCANTLRQCQIECRVSISKTGTKES